MSTAGIDVFVGRAAPVVEVVVVDRVYGIVEEDWRRGMVVGSLGRLGLGEDRKVLRRWGVGHRRCRSVVGRSRLFEEVGCTVGSRGLRRRDGRIVGLLIVPLRFRGVIRSLGGL